ncbi:MAG: helix-turn-helix transcriptional regulator [Terracidiphilus sp.]
MVKRLLRDPPWEGARLARFRKAAGYTQTALAQAVGVTRRMIVYYEMDTEYHPPAPLLVRLAHTLRISIDELLGMKPVRRKISLTPNRRIMRRLETISQLPAPELKALLRMIDAFLSKKR